uniref:leucine-rich repeat-containing protein 72 isoform X2 n=1 Tax=Pristiophorus japonicus TaxID=55135 RepID=UPI00398E6865
MSLNCIWQKSTLKHLTSLQILMLHNNWLTKVEKIISEFKRLRWMHTLNLFNNPLTQDRDYRLYVIYHLPSVQLLDRQQISQSERDAAFGHCNQDRLRINQTLAFGQRKPDFFVDHFAPKRSFKNYPGRVSSIPHQKDTDLSKRVNKDIKISSEHIVDSRIRRRSIMQFSTLDWTKVPTAQQKRLADEPMHLSQIITTQFR